jgi:periplasmic divalent cation tolerance protein
MSHALLVLTNLPDNESATMIAQHLVELGVAACVNILPNVKSVYRWQGKIETAGETTLLIKTTQARYAELEAALTAVHPYEVPEIIAVPIGAALPAYLDWIDQETKKNPND